MLLAHFWIHNAAPILLQHTYELFIFAYFRSLYYVAIIAKINYSSWDWKYLTHLGII